MRKFRTRKQWETLVNEQRESGMSVTAYCKMIGIHPVTFYKKRKGLKQESEFVKLTVNPQKKGYATIPDNHNRKLKSLGRIQIKIEDVIIEPEPGYDPQELFTIIRTVMEAIHA